MLQKLYKNQIKIWSIHLDEELYSRFKPYFYVLSSKEIERAAGFKVEWSRKVYILTRVILRLILSTYIGISPRLIKFYKNDYGKPFILLNDLHFNISHSNKKLAIAISKFEIGIDIEYVDPEFDFYEIINLVLSRSELLTLKGLLSHVQRKQFFLYWTQKEALLKAIGTGINTDLNTLDLSYNKKCSFKEWNINSFKILDSNYMGCIAYKMSNYKRSILVSHGYDVIANKVPP